MQKSDILLKSSHTSELRMMEEGKEAVISVERNTGLAIFELVSTEKAYLASLREIERGYIQRLAGLWEFQTTSLKTVFNAWTELTRFHETFLSELEHGSRDIKSLSKVFINHEEDFRIHYVEICLHYSNTLEDLSRIKSEESLEALKACQSQLCHALPLASYLLKPIQRILKYQMLLKVIEKSFTMGLLTSREVNSGYLERLDELNHHQFNLRKALQTMISVADFINEKKRMFELLEHLKSIDLDVESWGDLLKMNTFRMPKKKDRRLVLLFCNTLVVCKGIFDASINHDMNQPANQANSAPLPVIEIRHVIHFKKLMLIEFIAKNPLAFHVVHQDNPKEQVTFIADTKEIKALWCVQIKQLILDHYDVAIPEHARQLVLNMSANINSEFPAKRSSSASNASSKRKSSLNGSRIAKIKLPNLPLPINGVRGQSISQSPTMANVISEPLDVNGNPVHHFNGCYTSPLIPLRQRRLEEDGPMIRNLSPPRSTMVMRRETVQKEPICQDISNIDFRCIAIEINEEQEINRRRQSTQEISPQVRIRDNSKMESLINRRQHRLSISNKLMSALFNDSIMNSSGIIDFNNSQTSNGSSSYLSNNENYFLSTMSNRTSSASSNLNSGQYYENDMYSDVALGGQAKPMHLLSNEEIDQILKPIIDEYEEISWVTKKQLKNQEDNNFSNKPFDNVEIREKSKENKSPLQRSASQIVRKCKKNNLPPRIIEVPWRQAPLAHSISQMSLTVISRTRKSSTSSRTKLGNLIEAIPFVDDSTEGSLTSSNEFSEDSAYFTKRTSSLPYSISNHELNGDSRSSARPSTDEGEDEIFKPTLIPIPTARQQNKLKDFIGRFTSHSLSRIL